MVKNPPANAGDMRDAGSISELGRSPEGEVRQSQLVRQPTPVFLPGESHGHRSLAGYNPQGCTKLDMTEATQHVHMPLPQGGQLGKWSVCVGFQFLLVPQLSISVTTEPERIRWGGGLAQSACDMANYLHLRSSLSRKRHRQI